MKSLRIAIYASIVIPFLRMAAARYINYGL